MAFLEIDDVHKCSATTRCSRGIDLTSSEHQVVCLIGASGRGKSTLLRCINGLEPIDGGDDPARRRRRHRARASTSTGLRRDVGIVFQSFNLFPHMTVLRERDAGARARCCGIARSEATSEAMALLERIGLDEKAEEYPDRLSGGQQQRVAIVRALAMEPRVLLLDEITSRPRPRAGRRGARHRPRARRRRHDDAAGHARDGLRQRGRRRRCASSTQGVILEEGPPEQIFEHPERGAHPCVPGPRDPGGSPVTPRTLVVQHEHGTGPGLLGEVLAESGVELDLRRPYLGDLLPADLTGYDGLVVLGGTPDPYDDVATPWLPAVRTLLADALDREVPTLGICLGGGDPRDVGRRQGAAGPGRRGGRCTPAGRHRRGPP